MSEKRIREMELVLPALYFINEEPDITTSRLKQLLMNLLKPTGKDAEIARGRKDIYFEQKVRNLVSHRTLEKPGYAIYTEANSTHTITEKGKKFLQTNIDALEYLLSGDFGYHDIQSDLVILTNIGEHKKKILIYEENLVIEEGNRQTKNITVYERSKTLRDAAISHHTVNGHIKCSVCSFDFYSVYGERGRRFIEIHHQKPIFQYEEDQGTSMFIEQALQNVVPLCSNCHRMIHRERNAPISVDELKLIIQKASNVE